MSLSFLNQTELGEALFTACIHGDLVVVQKLLESAAAEDVNYLSFSVVSFNHPSTLLYFFQLLLIRRLQSLYTGLMMATAEGHKDVVDALLAHPDINANISAWVRDKYDQ